jgi:hypothetical protein
LDIGSITGGADNLVVLHLGHAWTAAGGQGTQVRIVRDRGTAVEQTIAGGVLHCLDYVGTAQTLPLTLFGTANLSGGIPHTISVDVKGTAGLSLGSLAAPSLMVVPAPRPVVQHARDTGQNLVAKAGSGSQDIDLDPIVIPADSGPHLLILQAAETWGSAQLVGASLRITRNGGLISSSQYFSAAAGQHLPTTVVTVYDTSSTSEEHTFGAAWSAYGTDYMNDFAAQGTIFPTALIGL